MTPEERAHGLLTPWHASFDMHSGAYGLNLDDLIVEALSAVHIEALEEAAKIADLIACSEDVAAKMRMRLEMTTRGDMLICEHVGGAKASKVIASAIREAKGTAVTE